MPITISLYNHTVARFASGANAASDTYKFKLLTAATFDAAHTTLAQTGGTQSDSSTGYPAGGATLTGVSIVVVALNAARFDADDISLTATGGSITASYGILYNDTDTDDPPVAFVDFGGSQTAFDGNPFKVVWNGAGIVTWVTDDTPLYTLPAATADNLGGVRGGANLTLSQDGVLSLSNANVVSALGLTPAGLGANTFSGAQNLADQELVRPLIKDYAEVSTAPAISAGTLTLNLEAGNVFDVALNAAITTLTITNPPESGRSGSFTLFFTADGTPRSVAWGAAVKWAGGTPPMLTSTNGKKDIFVMTTLDSGTNWYAVVAGQNF